MRSLKRWVVLIAMVGGCGGVVTTQPAKSAAPAHRGELPAPAGLRAPLSLGGTIAGHARPPQYPNDYVGPMPYGGGPLVSMPQIVPIFWTINTDSGTFTPNRFNGRMMAFYLSIVGNGYLDALSEYGVFGPASVWSASSLGQPDGVSVTTDHGSWTGISDDDVGNLIIDLINAGTIPLSDFAGNQYVYAVHLPAGLPSSNALGRDSACQDYCAYHDSVPTRSFDRDRVPYFVVPDLSAPGCRCNFTGDGNVFDNTTHGITHELAELLTDPLPDSGWEDGIIHRSEIGDICNDYVARLSTGPAATDPIYAVSFWWSNKHQGCWFLDRGGQGQSCAQDSDCEVGTACTDGFCTVPAPPPPTCQLFGQSCTSDGDCCPVATCQGLDGGRGTCKPPICGPINSVCYYDSDCCGALSCKGSQADLIPGICQ